MSKQLIQLATLSALCFALVSLNAAVPSYAADPTPTPAAADEYTVLSTTELDLIAVLGGTHAHISPNGELFAYGNDKELCFYTLAGDKQKCASIEAGDSNLYVDVESVVWSPDSSKIAFTSQFLVTLNNPGTWVMDTATGKIIKTTGIGFERASVLKGDNLVIDLAPQWLPDSQHLVFLRYYQVKKTRTGPFVNVLDVSSGDIKEYDNLISESLSIYWTSLSADGTLLAYTNDGRGSKIERGVWLYNFSDKSFKKLVGIATTKEIPRVMSFNADATQMLTANYPDTTLGTTPNENEYAAEKSPVRLIDVATGKQTLVDDERYVRIAGWSPSGKQIAYIVYDRTRADINGLYIATESGKAGKLVLSGFFIVPTSREGQPILWAANDTLLIADKDRGFKLTVVKLGVK